jgi:hypothetical protein
LLQTIGNTPWARKAKTLVKLIQYTSDVEKEVKFRLPGQESLIKLIRRGTAIDDELQHWTQTLPECWKLEKLFKSHRPWSEGAPRTIHVYKGIWASAEWNNYRAIRLHLLERLIELSNAIEESMNPYFELLANEWKRKAWRSQKKSVPAYLSHWKR